MYTKCNLSNATMNLYMRLICNKPVCFYKQWSCELLFSGRSGRGTAPGAAVGWWKSRVSLGARCTSAVRGARPAQGYQGRVGEEFIPPCRPAVPVSSSGERSQEEEQERGRGRVAEGLRSCLGVVKALSFHSWERRVSDYRVIAVRCFSGDTGSENDLKAGSLS